MLPLSVSVIPAKAGIQVLCGFLDPGLRQGDEEGEFPDMPH